MKPVIIEQKIFLRSTLKMNAQWSTIPLLPLSCILEHLSTKDAFSAMSTCRHWRNAVLLYEGHKETLKLRAKQLEKNLFVVRIFRKHTRSLHINIDCNEKELEKFMNFVLPQFLDTERLYELVFVGPGYVQQNSTLPSVKLNRTITETLLFKHKRFLRKFALLGCALDVVKNDDDRYIHKQVEYHSRQLKFNKVPFSGDSILSRCNSYAYIYYHLQHIICDYDQINTDCLTTLSNVSTLRLISLIVRRRHTWRPVDWTVVPGIEVAVHIVSLPYRRLDEVMDNILVEDLPLVSLKVMFCDVLYPRLLRHIAHLYKTRLRELVWVDTPYSNTDGRKPYVQLQDNTCNANPFILLCWQCQKLSRLVIHGYWLWQYDILGVVRLSSTVQQLEVSSVYGKQGRVNSSDDTVTRVMATDVYTPLDKRYVTQINSQADWRWKWRPISWAELPPGLRGHGTTEQRNEYIVKEICGITEKNENVKNIL